jgi:hypothetical protein
VTADNPRAQELKLDGRHEGRTILTAICEALASTRSTGRALGKSAPRLVHRGPAIGGNGSCT